MARMSLYDSFIYDCISKDNYRFRKENDQLKDMIEKFLAGEHSKEKFILEYRALIDKEKKEKEV